MSGQIRRRAWSIILSLSLSLSLSLLLLTHWSPVALSHPKRPRSDISVHLRIRMILQRALLRSPLNRRHVASSSLRVRTNSMEIPVYLLTLDVSAFNHRLASLPPFLRYKSIANIVRLRSIPFPDTRPAAFILRVRPSFF
jgi:hypothetical protein